MRFRGILSAIVYAWLTKIVIDDLIWVNELNVRIKRLQNLLKISFPDMENFIDNLNEFRIYLLKISSSNKVQKVLVALQ